MLERQKKLVLPLTLDGQPSRPIPEELIDGFKRVSSKRTHRLGLYAAIGDVTLKEALQAAYLQGMFDGVRSTE